MNIMTSKTLRKLKVKELKALAKQNKIKGFSKMKKADIIARLMGVSNIEELTKNLVIPEKKKRVMSKKQMEALAKGRAKMMLKRGLKPKKPKPKPKPKKKEPEPEIPHGREPQPARPDRKEGEIKVIENAVRFSPEEFRKEMKMDKVKRIKGFIGRANKFNDKKKGFKDILN